MQDKEASLLSDYAVSVQEADTPQVGQHMGRVIRVANSKIFGPGFRSVLETLLHNPRFYGSSSLPHRTGCIDVLSKAAEYTEELIREKHDDDMLRHRQFPVVMRRLHKNLMHGRVDFLPERFTLDKNIGPDQVRFANEIFNALPNPAISGIQRLSANLQYELFFRAGRTLHTGESALERIRTIRSQEKGKHGNASHVILSNAAQGNIVERVLKESPESPGEIIIIGGGSGATLAALADPLTKHPPKNRLNIVHIENSAMLAEEAARFGMQAVNEWNGAGGLHWSMMSGHGPVAAHNNLVMVEQGAIEALSEMQVMLEPTIVMCNYVLHHFSSRQKNAMLDLIKIKRPNSMILVGDQSRNNSESYRRYFGWTVCATINTGNEELEADLDKQGFDAATPQSGLLRDYRHLHSKADDRMFFAATVGDGKKLLEKAIK
jgi:hypothetical protein